ncbi:MAG: imidazolonepropionase-like amidohydrolase [Planctomycetota bacterium]|jgi:imidazolonepropionase-like amidohydrolase
MIVLTNVARLYDGTSDEAKSVKTGVDLWIDDGRIAEVTEHNPKLEGGEQLTQVDASKWTITPGLVDCHGHITILGLDAKAMEMAEAPANFVYVEKVLYTSLVDGGVTTMRDIGGATGAMKRMVEDGVVIGPRLKIAICMLSSTGGHADFRGPDRCHAELSKLWPAAPGRPSSIVDGPWEARKRVREIAACGGDLIKICSSPGVASPSDHLEHRDLHPEEVAAICEEAGARGMRVAAHAHSKSGVRLAAEYGVSDLQHISFMDEETVDIAHEKGCTVTPTSWILHVLPEADGLSEFVRDKAKRARDAHAAAVDYARKGGLPILAGTDPVLPGMHGRNYMEIVHLIKDGLDPLQAWWGMTGLAAREIGAQDTGTLVKGQRADFLICDQDVLSDPGAFERGALLEVVQAGRGHRGGVAAIPQRRFDDTVRGLLGERPGS